MPSFRRVVRRSTALALGLSSSLFAQQPPQLTRLPDGISLFALGRTTRLQVVAPSIVHVTVTPMGAPRHPSIAVLPGSAGTVDWKFAALRGATLLTTSRLVARIDSASGAVAFSDAISGKPILAESARSIAPANVQGEHTWSVQQQWSAAPDESLFGLGQQQLGLLDLKGYDLDLWQHNTVVALPFLVSSRGYGLFWDNTSYTRFGDLRPFVPIPAYTLLDQNGVAGGLTLTHPGSSASAVRSADLSVSFHPAKGGEHAPVNKWDGFIVAPETGDFQLRANFNGGLKVWVGESSPSHLVIDHWLQTWLTADNQARISLVAGHRYAIRVLTDPEQQTRMTLLWKTPSSTSDTSLWSEVADGIDYYFVYGPSLDTVIGGYRTLTGKATMLPDWAFGLWQSRQRYETQQQSLDVVKEFRQRRIPFDNIVQDWQYWRPDSWGSHEFDPSRFPHPDRWIEDIHALHAHLMISVWGKFNPNTENAREMQLHGWLYQPDLDVHMLDWIGFPYTFYDAFSAGARRLFWSQIDRALFSKGVDAWWMDASEPDLLPGEPPDNVEDAKTYMNPTAMGSGARMLSGWGLMNANAVYTGQRERAPNQRVFILTRSGYAGQQRYSTATWSGDVTSTWTALAKQIPAGLGMALSGIPYWTTDTAGYTMQAKFMGKPDQASNPDDEDEFRELNARWFEFSTFTPLLRVHGEVRPREMWLLGATASGPEASPVYRAELEFDRLRYRFIPYLYSLAGAVTQHDATIMRPLVMDFPGDSRARVLTDEFLFGPALLVAPVVHYQQRAREVYLPGSLPWYDLWTGRAVRPGTLTADAPYDRIPIFVRAGSILPLGPDIQYVGEKPDAPVTLQIFEGADGAFTLYEDQGTTFDYEHGAFTEIPLTWTDASRTLNIGTRRGSFPGFPRNRTFQIVVNSRSSPAAFSLAPTSIRSIEYDGSALTLKLPQDEPGERQR